MPIFNDREQAQENKYGRELAHNFEITMTRNQLIGLWMAEKIGLQGPAIDEYIETVIQSDFEKPGPEDVIAKLMRDIKKHNLEISEDQIRRKMIFFEDRAQEKFAAKK
jgi:hypothetical protein